MRWLSFMLVLLCASIAAAAGLSVQDAYVPEPPPGQTMAAMYLTVSNPLDQKQVLVSAKSDQAAKVEIHTHVHANGQMKMQRVERVELPARSETVFKPGGMHLMVFGLKRALQAGDELPVTLSLADGAQLQVVGRVRDTRR